MALRRTSGLEDLDGDGWEVVQESLARTGDRRTVMGVLTALTPSCRLHVLVRPGYVRHGHGGDEEAFVATEVAPRMRRLIETGPGVDGWQTETVSSGEELHQLWLIEHSLPPL